MINLIPGVLALLFVVLIVCVVALIFEVVVMFLDWRQGREEKQRFFQGKHPWKYYSRDVARQFWYGGASSREKQQRGGDVK